MSTWRHALEPLKSWLSRLGSSDARAYAAQLNSFLQDVLLGLDCLQDKPFLVVDQRRPQLSSAQRVLLFWLSLFGAHHLTLTISSRQHAYLSPCSPDPTRVGKAALEKLRDATRRDAT